MRYSGTRARQSFRKLERVRSGSSAPACRVLSAAATDVGLQRRNNEDTFRCDDSHGLYLVCDGMGGMAAGEIASRIAADTMVEHYLRLRMSDDAPDSTEDILLESVRAANGAVVEAAHTPGLSGMGTTLVGATLDGDRWLVINVGDSRAYVLHAGELRQITRDHSYMNEVKRMTGLSAEDISAADLLRFGALITRAVGASDTVEPDLYSLPLHDGDLLLLATDGLTRYFEDTSTLVPLLNADDLQGSCEALIASANAAGGLDNTTVVLLRCVANV